MTIERVDYKMSECINAVEIKNLTKRYGGNKALNDINFNVRKGEIMGFLGPNGAGKSTTMNIICGCISPTSGNASVCGFDVLENPAAVKSRIGYLPENPPLYFDMTVGEYLDFVYDLKKVNADKETHLKRIMERVQIYDKKDRLIKNLSKGYKQRVGLAQALIGDPEVLILDEPTVGLDPKQIIEIRNVIKELGKERTIILSTHILQEVEAVCDSVTIISHGQIVAQNTIEGLIEETGGKDKYILGVMADAQTAQQVISDTEGVRECQFIGQHDGTAEFCVEQNSGEDIRLALTQALANNSIAIAYLRSANLTLEEMFIKLTNTDAAAVNVAEEAVVPENISEEAENNESNI